MCNDEERIGNHPDMYSEVYEILRCFTDDLISRIPDELMTFIKECRNIEYVPVIDENKPLREQKVREDTFAFMALLKLSFWSDSKEEQRELMRVLTENQVNSDLKKTGGIHIIIDESEN